MPCALLEKYVSFLPDEKYWDSFAAVLDTENVRQVSKALRFAVRAEEHNAARTRRRVGAASNIILNMLYAESVNHLVERVRRNDYQMLEYQEEDTLNVSYLNNWLMLGDRRLRDLRVAHVEFMLSPEEVRRGSAQLADSQRMRLYNQTEALCDAVRAVQKYIEEPVHAHAGRVGQHLYNLCGHQIDTSFALRQGVRLLHLK